MEDQLYLFNTMSGKKERFIPMNPPHVKMFVCGPTVQAPMHLGHARTYIFYDALARYLSHLGYDVFFLMNITDLDETITKAADKAGEDPLAFSARMADSFLTDMKTLKVETVDRFEPASHHVGEMVAQVSSLVGAGFAYEADGWVYFDTTKFPKWGRLSHQSKQDLSLRPLELSPEKRNLNDFGLWRPEVLVPGMWRSPWGLGTPGWHIQDTAITMTALGSQYDLHGGAFELVYPHHEAEIAQGESLSGERPLVKYWVHTNLVKMEGEKMSKSLGNVVTVKEALRHFTPAQVRFYFLSIHYRKDATLSGLVASCRRLEKIRRTAVRLAAPGTGGTDLAGFERAINDDFDTPGAIRWVESTLRKATAEGGGKRGGALARAAAEGMGILGVDLLDGS